ncbi:MAG TPA: flagellar filament capping protein FliD [Acidiferrobacterales bacterium]|nr:flagellar filament capping protein FliD [Acidiferrobacterales bacterium]
MASITSAGIGSGLDINGLINQIMTFESRPLASLDRKEAGYQARLSAYGSVKGAVSAFQSAMLSLSSPARFQGLRAASADSTIYTASATSAAAPGSYAVEVKQLAQAQKLASKAFTNTTDTVGTGTLTIQFGTWSGGVFTANATKASQTVTIGSGNSSLAGIRDAINAAKVGVTAAILNDGTGNRLVLTSGESGAANGLKITVADTSDASNTDDAGLSQLAHDPAGSLGNGKNLTETVAAQNALLKVDGIDNISKSSNTVTDVVQGVTLTLLKQSTANTSTALTVSRDTASVKSAVEGFAKAYNDVNKTIRDLTAYDAKTRQGAILQGDSSVLSILSQVRSQLTTNLAGVSGTYTQLSQIGVAFQTDGSLAVDGTKLQTALDSNFNEIAGLFVNLGRPSDSLVSYVSATGATKPGAYSVNVTQLATRGLLNGTNTAALDDTNDDGTFDTAVAITADNDTFSVKVDGIQAGTITLAQGNYTTTAALAAEIQSKINGDSALKAAGVTVTASFDNAAGAGADRLALTSDRYGSASKVEITAIDTTTATTLGFAAGSGTDGVDVAGSIAGTAATGSGRALTGATGTVTEGLKLEILGGATGDRGSVNYSQGYAYLLDKLAGQILGSNGAITSRTDGLNKSIEDIADRREVLNRRLGETERRLRAQFSALDGLLARLRSTSDSLSRQLASLPTIGGSSS